MDLFLGLFIVTALGLLGIRIVHAGTVSVNGSLCTVRASLDGSDDAPAILAAFDLCRRDSVISFVDDLYHIESVMNTTNLSNVQVHLHGTLLVSFPTHSARSHTQSAARSGAQTSRTGEPTAFPSII